jgi:hypothetical protein
MDKYRDLALDIFITVVATLALFVIVGKIVILAGNA